MKEIGQFYIQEKGRSDVFFLGLIQSTIIARGQYCSPFKWKEVEDDYHSKRKRKKEERKELKRAESENWLPRPFSIIASAFLYLQMHRTNIASKKELLFIMPIICSKNKVFSALKL